jgi:hypothetical protein
MGVSTSKKPLSFRKVLTKLTILDLVLNNSNTSLFVIKSKQFLLGGTKLRIFFNVTKPFAMFLR